MTNDPQRPRNLSLAVALVGSFLLALGIRVAAARHAYPASGDVIHFIQHAREAGGQGFSAYWSQGMQVAAWLALRMGLDPARALQGLAVVTGALLVPAVAGLAWNATGRVASAGLAGLLVAVNPALVKWSATGYAEMPYAACVAFGAVLMLGRRPSGWRSWAAAALAGILFAGAVWMKALDALVTFGLFGGMAGILALVRRDGARVLRLLAVLAVFLVTGFLPMGLWTRARTGEFGPGAKSSNLALGDHWGRSAPFASETPPYQDQLDYLETHGTAALLWQYRARLARRWPRWAAEGVRIQADQATRGPFRLGPGWFVVLLGACGWFLLVSGRLVRSWPMLMLATAAPLFIFLCFVHERLLMGSFPFVLGWMGAAFGAAWPAGRRFRAVWIAVAAGWALTQARIAVRDAGWDRSAFRQEAAAERFLEHVRADDRIMATGWILPLQLQPDRSLSAIQVPSDPLDRVSSLVRQKGVSLVIVSEWMVRSWPARSLVDDNAWPEGWELVDEVTFPEEERWGMPAERFRVWRVGLSPP